MLQMLQVTNITSYKSLVGHELLILVSTKKSWHVQTKKTFKGPFK